MPETCALVWDAEREATQQAQRAGSGDQPRQAKTIIKKVALCGG